MYVIATMVFILFWVAVIWIWWRSRGFDRARWPTLEDAINGLRAYQSPNESASQIVFRDRVCASLADMHPDDRREYQQLHSIPPVPPEPEPNPVPPVPEDPAETLRKLRDMKYAGLITEDDYEAKKAEILARI